MTESVFEYWREKLGVEVGMSKEEALECFREWRLNKKTCERCEGEEYVSFCPVHVICRESDVGGMDIAIPENTPIFLPSMGFKHTSIAVISTSKGGDATDG